MITKEVSPVAYQLELPAKWKIHNVFHASLLSAYHETEQYGPANTPPPPELIEGELEYKVEAILKHRYHGPQKKFQYLIRWKGYIAVDDTWEPQTHINANNLL